jgi:2'-5' RNA ligase
MTRPANLRLFVAIHPPHEIAQGFLKATDSLNLPPHRPTPREQVHLTLQFIGDTPARKLESTIESMQRAVAGLPAFQLVPLRLITLPPRGPARLVAAQTSAPPALLEIHRRLATRLARNVRGKDEERFRPHLTLSRFRSPVSGFVIDQALELPAFSVDRIVLMRSTLAPDGAQHHEVASFALGEG